MARTTDLPWTNFSTLLPSVDITLPWGIDKITAYDFLTELQYPVQWVLNHTHVHGIQPKFNLMVERIKNFMGNRCKHFATWEQSHILLLPIKPKWGHHVWSSSVLPTFSLGWSNDSSYTATMYFFQYSLEASYSTKNVVGKFSRQ